MKVHTETHRVIEGAAAATEIGISEEEGSGVFWFFAGWWAGAISIAFVLWVI